MRKKKWPVLLAGALLVGLLLAAAVLAPWKEGGTEEGVPVVAEAEPKADTPEPAEAPLTGGGTLEPGDWTLAAAQRETLLAYYIQQKNIPTIAAERSVAKSTVSRTLRRAEGKVRRFLRY